MYIFFISFYASYSAVDLYWIKSPTVNKADLLCFPTCRLSGLAILRRSVGWVRPRVAAENMFHSTVRPLSPLEWLDNCHTLRYSDNKQRFLRTQIRITCLLNHKFSWGPPGWRAVRGVYTVAVVVESVPALAAVLRTRQAPPGPGPVSRVVSVPPTNRLLQCYSVTETPQHGGQVRLLAGTQWTICKQLITRARCDNASEGRGVGGHHHHPHDQWWREDSRRWGWTQEVQGTVGWSREWLTYCHLVVAVSAYLGGLRWRVSPVPCTEGNKCLLVLQWSVCIVVISLILSLWPRGRGLIMQ